ncbi:MAG: thioredoxin family protein [Pseudomonadota bacterium]
MTVRRALAVLAVLVSAGSLPATASPDGLRLLMVDQTWCEWCERWDAEIAGVYPITDEGRAAPLIRHDIHDPLPDGVVLDRPARFTPTFILLCAGREAGRIEGYPGEDFFWALLARLLDDLDSTADKTDTANAGADATPTRNCDAQS